MTDPRPTPPVPTFEVRAPQARRVVACDCSSPAHCLEAAGGEQGLTAEEHEVARLRRELAAADDENARLRRERIDQEAVSLEMGAERDAAHAELAKDLARCARLESERDDERETRKATARVCRRALARADRFKEDNAWLRAALVEVVKDHDKAQYDHNPAICSRTYECDEAEESGRECSYCSEPCPPCECGLAETEELVARARALLSEASR